MKKISLISIITLLISLGLVSSAFSFWGSKVQTLSPKNGVLEIPTEDINDGKAHHFNVKAADGTLVTFFTLKSRDGIIRAAIDACDVCYKSGKGYEQEGDFMVCQNCGQKFSSNKINEIKGGCNPAPLERMIVGKNLVIAMADINKNSWYASYRK